MWHCNVDYKNDTKTIWANIYRIRKSCRIWSINNLLHIPPKMLCNLPHTHLDVADLNLYPFNVILRSRCCLYKWWVSLRDSKRRLFEDLGAFWRTFISKLRSDVVMTYMLYLNFDRVDGLVKNDARNSSGQRKTDSNGLWREGQQCCCVRGWVGNQTLNAHRLVTGPKWWMADEGGLWQGCCVCGWAEKLRMITDPSDRWWTRVGSMLEIVRNPSLYRC